MRLLFWNLRSRSPIGLLNALVDEHAADIVLLAECATGDTALVDGVNAGRSLKFFVDSDPQGRIKMLIRLPRNSVRRVSGQPHISIRHIAPPAGVDCLLVAVHLRSKLFQTESDQALAAQRVRVLIEEAEAYVGTSRTVVVGDFNMNPFEPGLVAAEGLHAVMSRGVAAQGTRVVGRSSRRFFYNPMWNFFGDTTPGPPGTFFRRDGNQICYFWNTFDQVLVRPALLDRLEDTEVRVLTRAGGVSLLNRQGRPDRTRASDHLPLLFDLDLNA